MSKEKNVNIEQKGGKKNNHSLLGKFNKKVLSNREDKTVLHFI